MVGLVHEPAVGGSVDWFTPAWLFGYLLDDDGKPLGFDLDPCAPAGGLPWIPAARFYSLPDDGLAMPWGGRMWMNPPYGSLERACGVPCTKKRCAKRGYHAERDVPGMDAWLAKFAANGCGIALTFGRTDPDWFHEHAATADVVLFLRERIQHVGLDGKPKPNDAGEISQPGVGSMLMAWGEVEARSLERAARMLRNGKPLGTAFWRTI